MMTQDRRDWVNWILVIADPSAGLRGFSLEGLEFKTVQAEPVQDEMYGTLPGDTHVQPGKYWIVSEQELMRICPQMERFAQNRDWYFPVEFCRSSLRPHGVEPVQTRDATATERQEALGIFQQTQRKISPR